MWFLLLFDILPHPHIIFFPITIIFTFIILRWGHLTTSRTWKKNQWFSQIIDIRKYKIINFLSNQYYNSKGLKQLQERKVGLESNKIWFLLLVTFDIWLTGYLAWYAAAVEKSCWYCSRNFCFLLPAGEQSSEPEPDNPEDCSVGCPPRHHWYHPCR